MEERSFEARILRQDHPDKPGYWQTFRLRYEKGLNVTSVLQRIAATPMSTTQEAVAPVAYEANCLEEVCGSCTMVINGRVRQACSALVDSLLDGANDSIELRPMSKFPVIRDLIVDRDRLFQALSKLECWLPVDDYDDRGPGPNRSQEEQEEAYPLTECMSCGCCLEACPQYTLVDLRREATETDEQFEDRKGHELDRRFIGAHAANQAVLMNSITTGAMANTRRIKTMTEPGGIQNCGKAGNCQAVCPKEIPLMTSWARAGREATLHTIRTLFDG